MIEVKSVTKRYGDFTAIEDISFSTPPCSITGLVGYNGAGKTTLIKIAAGIYKADEGKVLLSGEDVFNNNNERKRLFFVPDELYFPASSTLKTMAAYYKGYYPNFDIGIFNKLTKLFSLTTDKAVLHFDNVNVTLCAVDSNKNTDITEKLTNKRFDTLIRAIAEDTRALKQQRVLHTERAAYFSYIVN